MKRALSIVLALVLCIALTAPALAADGGDYEEIYMNGFMSNAPWWGMFGVEFEAVRMEWGSITFYSEETGAYTEDGCSILAVKPGSKVTVDGSYGAGVEDAPESFCAIVNAYKLRPDGSYELLANDVTISSGVIEDWPLGRAVADGGDTAALLELPGGFSSSRYVRIDEAPAARDDVSVTLYGAAVVFPDAKPFIDENGRTMVPLRAVAEALGLTVSWDGAAREASFTDGSRTIIFPIGSTTARTEDGGLVEMDTAAVIVSDRTFAPIRYLARHFGYPVDWDSATRTVLIG